jgi:hypothetical protein
MPSEDIREIVGTDWCFFYTCKKSSIWYREDACWG